MMSVALSLARVYRKALVPIDEMKAAIAAETDVSKVVDFSKRAEVARIIDARNGERRNYWAELSIWSSRRLGEMLRMAQEEGTLATKANGRPRKEVAHDELLTLSDINIERNQAQRAQSLAAIPEETIEAFVEKQRDVEDEISKAGLIRFANGTEKAGTAAHVSQNTGVPEWYTPTEYLDAARKALGEIDLDPASSVIAQKRVKAKKYYTLEQDGLSKQWAGRVFLNPPYSSNLVGRFTGRLCDSFESGHVPAAILLVNNATETTWFQCAAEIAVAICFPKGRIKFIDEQGNSGSPLQGQAILYFGKAVKRFTFAFDEFGFCVVQP